MRTTKPNKYETNCHFHFMHRGYEDDWEKLLDCWKYTTETNKSLPKLCTYGELTDLGYLGENSDAYNDTALNDYVYRFFDNMDLELTIDNKTHLEIQEHNWVFHKVKIQWLINQYRTIGLYSCIQGRFKNIPKWEKQHKHHSRKNFFVHPGMSRVHALRHLRAFDSKVIVWDPNNQIDKKPLTFDEWYGMFEGLKDIGIFATNIGGFCIEMHVNEERKDMYDTVKEVKINMYKQKRPLLIGNCQSGIEKCFRRDNDKTGVIIETKNDYELKFEDLRFFLDLFPGVSENVDNERFRIYRAR